MATDTKTSTSAQPSLDLKETEKLEVIDSRTKKSYSFPISQGGVEGDTVVRLNPADNPFAGQMKVPQEKQH